MRRAFYALPRAAQIASRAAVSHVRHGWNGTPIQEAAFDALDIDLVTIERTHKLDIYDRVAERLALTPEADRAPIEAALFGGPSA